MSNKNSYMESSAVWLGKPYPLGATYFTMPPRRWGEQWQLVMDTERGFIQRQDATVLKAGDKHRVIPRVLGVWMR